MSKGAVIGIVVVILVSVAAEELFRARSRDDHRVTKEAYDKIVKGMSMEEVRSMLGGCAYDEVASRTNDNYYANSVNKHYVGPTGTIVVHVQKGVVLGKRWIDKEVPTGTVSQGGDLPPPPPPPSSQVGISGLDANQTVR